MNCRRKLLSVALTLGLSAGGLGVSRAQDAGRTRSGQSPASRDQDLQGLIRTTVSLVVVPVTVKDRAGELVSDLRQSDFRIFEDNMEQRITSFSSEAFPLSAAVLIDNDLKRGTAEKVQKTLESIAGGFSESDEVSLWRFDSVPDQVSDFTSDNDGLIKDIQRINLSSSFPGVGSAPMTSGPVVNTQPLPGSLEVPSMAAGHPNNKHINDAIYAAAEQLRERPRDRRKIIFLISDGENAKNNTHSYNDTLKPLLSENISVYAIGVGEANLNRGITFLGNNILLKYAHSTGGDIFYTYTHHDLEGLYARVSEQARNQYTIAYSAAGTDRSQAYHSIEVRVTRPGLSLIARDGYYLGDKP